MGDDHRTLAPLSLGKVALAILPGLFVLGVRSGLFGRTFNGGLAESGLFVTSTLVVVMGIAWERRIATWSYPALGILLYNWGVVFSLFADSSHPFWQVVPPLIMLVTLVSLAIFAVVRAYRRHGIRIPKLALWLLCATVILGIIEIIGSIIADQNPERWSALPSALPLLLWWMGTLLLPIVIGLPLAGQNGLTAGLIVVAAQFILIDSGFDPGYALGMWTSNQVILWLVEVLPAAGFLILSPIWVLRARTARGRVLGLLLPTAIALIGAEAIAATARPYPDVGLTRAMLVAQFLTALMLTVAVYRQYSSSKRALPSALSSRAEHAISSSI